MPEEKKRRKRRDYRAELDQHRIYCETMAIAFKKIAGSTDESDVRGQKLLSAADAYADLAERMAHA